MKKIALFQPCPPSHWPVWKKLLFWFWNIGLVFCSFLGIGGLSLLFAAVVNRKAMILSYFQHPLIAFLNLAPVLLLGLMLYFLLGRAGLSYGITAVIVLGLTIASWFKLQFRNDPLMFEDLLLLKEAGNMAGKYQLFLTKTMAAALLLVVLGFVYPFLYSVKSASDAPPDGYDEKRAQSILSAYEDADIPEEQKVSVLSIMLESYDDFTKYGVPELDPKVYEDYHALEAESVTGNLITNIFAGGTVDSERCFLTGFSRLGSFRSLSNSYPWYFRSQGYTVTGAHPCYAWFYNRENINRNLGFEDYKFVENYFSPMTGGDVGYDDLFFPELIQLWEANKALGKPVFTYDLTYQGHGPYSDDTLWWEDGYDYVLGGDYTDAERNILNNYFGSIYNTNQNLKAFFDYFRGESEPVVIVVFGDHNPWLGDGNAVYEAMGLDLDFSTEEGFYNYYSTRYLIWANDAAKEALDRDFTGQGPTISPNFLMNEVFRQCGWDGNAFMQATQQVMDQVPVINTPTGLYVEGGRLTAALTPEGQALVDDYHMLQYYWRRHFAYDSIS